MSESKNTPATGTKADAKETKLTKKVGVVGSPAGPSPDEKKSNKPATDGKAAIGPEAGTPGTPAATAGSEDVIQPVEQDGLAKALNVSKGEQFDNPDQEVRQDPLAENQASDQKADNHNLHVVDEADLESEPVLKQIGVVVGDDMSTVARKAIWHIYDQEGKKANKSASEPRVTKDEVLAEKDGEERTFPRAAWNNMGRDRNGWVAKANTPSEARKGGNKMSEKNIRIRHKGTRKVRHVTQREWESISSNPLVSESYEMISKPAAADVKSSEDKGTKANANKNQ